MMPGIATRIVRERLRSDARTCASAELRVLSDTGICFTPGIKKPAGAGYFLSLYFSVVPSPLVDYRHQEYAFGEGHRFMNGIEYRK
jgi:hypothetical protein